MEASKIIIIIIIIFLLYIIISRFLSDRLSMLTLEEGFTGGSTTDELTIQSISSARANLPLLEYSIKASYNSAYDGTNVSLVALDNVLSRGCRFLDFEIYSINESPSVAYSVDKSFSTLTSGNSLLLKDVFNEIIGNCFTGNVPNPRDPIFIHLRLNTTCGLNNSPACSIYQDVAKVISTTLLPKLYVDASGNAISVTGSSILADMAGKIILVMDASINRDYKNYAKCDSEENCYDLQKYVNIESGGNTWFKYKFSDFINRKENPLAIDSSNPMVAEPSTGTLNLQMVLPDIGSNVQNGSFPLTNISIFGCQTIFMKFYKKDTALTEYESMFNEYKTAFLPLGYAVQYITGK